MNRIESSIFFTLHIILITIACKQTTILIIIANQIMFVLSTRKTLYLARWGPRENNKLEVNWIQKKSKNLK
jgi:hypothetical protein